MHYETGKQISILFKKELSEGFHIMLRLKKDSDYIIHKCKCHNNKNQPCVFRINLQAINYNTKKQYYEITKFSCLKYNHTLNSFLFTQHFVDKKTKTIESDKSAVNIDLTKISEFLYKVSDFSLDFVFS